MQQCSTRTAQTHRKDWDLFYIQLHVPRALFLYEISFGGLYSYKLLYFHTYQLIVKVGSPKLPNTHLTLLVILFYNYFIKKKLWNYFTINTTCCRILIHFTSYTESNGFCDSFEPNTLCFMVRVNFPLTIQWIVNMEYGMYYNTSKTNGRIYLLVKFGQDRSEKKIVNDSLTYLYQ